ncbi:shikimate 5-dehydrogenase [Paracoccus mutanolyticus]|uniref:shikimate 5-dehydrogenase n=1 Tax=Paracoccus mutanolyticus TaxID=1499308 RepID=UPI001CB97D54|nr:shikimate 5-dehydrogenase [Paracoccus mutanolyticus]
MAAPEKPPIGPATQLCMSLAARPGSFGSRFHNRLYERLGLDFVYKAFTTRDLPAAIGGIRALGVRGCAISMPFKEAVIPLLDGLAPSAAAIDSVNTIVNDAGLLTGHNTDYSAVAQIRTGRSSRRAVPVARVGRDGQAVAAALRDRGHRSGVIVARNAASGPRLAQLYGFDWAESDRGLTAPLIVNVTPLGMQGPDAEALAFSPQAIDAALTVFDVVALPEETPLMRAAQAAGKRRISGAEVAVLQALEQFVLYTGIRPDPDQLRDAATFARAA